MWNLWICLGITWAGCSDVRNFEYPSEESCYRAIAAMQIVKSEADKKQTITAVCRPK